MARWYGKIGYIETQESEPGNWLPDTTERYYYGELIRNTGKFQTSGEINDDRNISNELSIVSDPYAYQHFHSMRYVEFMGVKWKITNVEVKRPRLILTLGGVYNG